jgi:hypothetical protein
VDERCGLCDGVIVIAVVYETEAVVRMAVEMGIGKKIGIRLENISVMLIGCCATLDPETT